MKGWKSIPEISQAFKKKKKKVKPSSWVIAMGISELDHVLDHFCDHQPPADSFDQEVLLPVALPSQPTLSTTLLASGLVGAARKVPFPSMAFFFFSPAWKICWYRFELQMLARPQDSNSGVHHWGGGRHPPSPTSPALAGWGLGPPGSQRWPGLWTPV